MPGTLASCRSGGDGAANVSYVPRPFLLLSMPGTLASCRSGGDGAVNVSYVPHLFLLLSTPGTLASCKDGVANVSVPPLPWDEHELI
jgi:hypothetical protein